MALIISREDVYPEINVQVPAASKLAIAHLESHGHLVVGVELLVEAFSRVRAKLDVVGGGEANQGQQ